MNLLQIGKVSFYTTATSHCCGKQIQAITNKYRTCQLHTSHKTMQTVLADHQKGRQRNGYKKKWLKNNMNYASFASNRNMVTI